jgi:hypothetical protein
MQTCPIPLVKDKGKAIVSKGVWGMKQPPRPFGEPSANSCIAIDAPHFC